MIKNERNAHNDIVHNLLVMFSLADLKMTQLEPKWLPKWMDPFKGINAKCDDILR